MANRLVSLIIPSLEGVPGELEQALGRQSWSRLEILSVIGVKPVARARNQGARRASGDILIFMDDDCLPGNDTLLEALVRTLDEAPRAGVVGAEERLPASSNWLQRRLSFERPRTVQADPRRPRETFTGINTTCWALTRDLFAQLGGFNETMVAGDDFELLYRARWIGKRHYVAPGTWVIHPPPSDIKTMLKKYHWYGMGDAQITMLHPEWQYNMRLGGTLSILAYLAFRTAFLIPNVFIPVSFKHRDLRLSFRPLQALSSYSAALGYAKAWRRKDVRPWPPRTPVPAEPLRS